MTISPDDAAVEMTHLWKSKNDSHTCLEISHRTRDSHIPTSRFRLVKGKKKTKERRINRPQSGSLSERRTGLLSERRLHRASRRCTQQLGVGPAARREPFGCSSVEHHDGHVRDPVVFSSSRHRNCVFPHGMHAR